MRVQNNSYEKKWLPTNQNTELDFAMPSKHHLAPSSNLNNPNYFCRQSIANLICSTVHTCTCILKFFKDSCTNIFGLVTLRLMRY